ncbi:hypothetical protein E1I18_03100 [Mycoplasmopsis mucosicanis]|uniref:Uncharacterized protein n=1 Tax=Mycoplasmopsis mucosicanis TaxID=458208 RepID=A0A507SQD8_9BACT|nr:M42 family metallopeptidase [Mycoplasmopsis mucosicanis]TQC51333.1 hypothetical protein E1I18_03100 [Mycoplasmopsis mucosicanis]
MKSLNLKEKIDYITSILSKYNQTNQTNLKIIIKGSAILSTKNLIDREPNDIDICFVNNENLQVRREFISYLTKIGGFEILRSDDNLITIFNKQFGNVEFILFEYIDTRWIENAGDNIYFTNIDYLLVGKITMLTYVMSSYYLHSDKEQKINNTISDLKLINEATKVLDNFDIDNYKSVLLNLINNSTLIYVYYKYDKFLWWEESYNSFKVEKDELKATFNKIKTIFARFSNDKDVLNYIRFNSRLISNFHSNLIDTMLKKYSLISPPGNEKILVQNLFDKYSDKNGYYEIFKGASNVFINAHCDEVMGLIVDNKIYSLGTLNWIDKCKINIFDDAGNLIAKNLDIRTENNYVFSPEKNVKINRPKALIQNNAFINENSHKNIYYCASNVEPIVQNFNFTSRNNDNKINVFLLNWLCKNDELKSNVILTKSEEVYLNGAKSLKNTIKSNYFINLETSQYEKWQNQGLLIRIADFFTTYKPIITNKIMNILDKYSIPFSNYFGSGSSDITELSQNEYSITLALPCDLIHSMNSSICIFNIIYMLQAIFIIDKELNNGK